ncbi:Oidioi.mRNA.OKI2018_I69.PAR.g12375.t1.cds [Oikopleura dioica]|uniref:Oidioi.mRNA.OKI2018_I69.PAR.g12375.t1.cds n=1 Tax=Oikopleura dioica TaxID=34765 RepID=A0ABN7S075_OIKDI|nr:Oidioi.mRNA.OKI2018_I69.PAR.g12375.t1.cds [Oikopleura dioica]
MEENFGNLLYYKKPRKTSDPYAGYKVLHTLGDFSAGNGKITFAMPPDKLPIKLDRCAILFQLKMPSNFVPDNGFASKIIDKFNFYILDECIFSTWTNGLEYLFFNNFVKKLNYSPKAQEVELFPEGHYDSYDADADELLELKCKHNGLNLVENRQQYAMEEWKELEKPIKISTGKNAVDCEMLYHRYLVRSPISHGLARQQRVLPADSRVKFEILTQSGVSTDKPETPRRMAMRWSEYQKVRTLEKNIYKKDDKGHLIQIMTYPFDKNIQLVNEWVEHLTEEECDCAASKFTSADEDTEPEYLQIEPIGGDYLPKTRLNELYTKGTPVDEKNNIQAVQGTWRAHKVYRRVPKYDNMVEGNNTYVIFWAKTSTDFTLTTDMLRHLQIESVFCTPTKDERPFIIVLQSDEEDMRELAGTSAMEATAMDTNAIETPGMEMDAIETTGMDTTATATPALETNDDDLSFVDFDNLTENAISKNGDDSNSALQTDDDLLHYNSDDLMPEPTLESNSSDDNKDENSLMQNNRDSVESSLYTEYMPIRNVLTLIPNVFNDQTLVRILPDRMVIELPKCKTPNCLYTHADKRKMKKHEATCNMDTIDIIHQTVESHRIMDHVHELVAENFLPSFDYVQEYFVVYDIECTMNCNGLSSGDKYHKLATLATVTSNGERECFVRKTDEVEGSLIMLTEFINYLLILQKKMESQIPGCIFQGVQHYEKLIEDENKKKEAGLGSNPFLLAAYRKKLKYLKDFYKLKIYSWVGERYDMVVLFPTLISVLFFFVGGNTKLISFIKRASGYMVLEALNLSFRDFKNYTCPMALEKLARSCGLSEELFVKGSFCYEWYNKLDHIKKAKELPAYPCFYSTMSVATNEYVIEMDKIIATNIEEGKWKNEQKEIASHVCRFLKLTHIFDDPVAKEHYDNLPPAEGASSGESLFQIRDTIDLYVKWKTQIEKFICWSSDKNRWHLDEDDEATCAFFRFSPKMYRASVERWYALEEAGENDNPTTMMDFLIDYNYNDCVLLQGSISSFALSNQRRFGLGIHSELSISQLAHKIAFLKYDKKCPPIYSISPDFPELLRDMRKNLTGGIVQVLHRAIYLNGPNPAIPEFAWKTLLGKIIKAVITYDFNSLYPQSFRGDLPCGPGIKYTLQKMGYSSSMCYSEEERFFSKGMFHQRQNTSLGSIRWLEYLNWSPDYSFNGSIEHSYNLEEKKIGSYYIDGYAESEDEPILILSNDDGNSPIRRIKKRYFFEYRGCTFHPCTNKLCKIKPTCAPKKELTDPATGAKIFVPFTKDGLLKNEDARMQKIIEDVRKMDGIEDWGKPLKHWNGSEWEETEGPQNFPHCITIKMACEWRREWKILESTGKSPSSKTYPFLFKSARKPSGLPSGHEGVTEAEFKKLVLEEDENGESRFFGFAMVDLRSPPSVIEKYKYMPPIFARKKLEREDLQGDLSDTLSENQKKRMFPCEENIFCFNVDNYFISSQMLHYYAKMGIEYRVKYFLSYYRGKPFENFVNELVADRVKAAAKGDQAGQNWIKFILNSAVGYFAINRSKFLKTRILSSGDLYTALRNPRLKSLTTLQAEKTKCDPLHEAIFTKKMVNHSTALQVQLFVYQNSKLLFFKFRDVLNEYMEEGSVQICYCDTDSFVLALAEKTLDECVKPSLKDEWETKIKPKWFATESPASQKEPGLLKVEAEIYSGWFIALSAKCYIMTECEPNRIDEAIVAPENRHRVFEVLDEHNRAFLNETNVKRSAKGCAKKIKLRYLDYLAALFSDNSEESVVKNMPLFMYDQVNKQIKTKVMSKRVINGALKKRIIDKDKIRTYALKKADGTYY